MSTCGRVSVSKAVAKRTGFAVSEVDYVIRECVAEICDRAAKGSVISFREYFTLRPVVVRGRKINHHLPREHPDYGIKCPDVVRYQFCAGKELNAHLRVLDTSSF